MTAESLATGAVPVPDALRMALPEIPEAPFDRREVEYRVVLELPAHQEIVAHAESNPDIEVCGVLVGDVYKDAQGPYLIVVDAIRGRSAREANNQVTFTHSTWELVNREMDRKHPGRRIVGWYHTHPGFGVFLSEVDLFAHRNFFNAAWQVALVVDQKSRKEGLFFWQDGQIVRARRYWVGQDARWEPGERPVVSTPSGMVQSPRRTLPTIRMPSGDEGGALDGLVPPSTLVMGVLGVLCVIFFLQTLRADSRSAQLATSVAALQRQFNDETRRDDAQLARALAFRLREQLDRGGATPVDALRALYDATIKLDPDRRRAYELLLPELVPPPPAAPKPQPPGRGAAGGQKSGGPGPATKKAEDAKGGPPRADDAAKTTGTRPK
jgi:proteasome lid subunit RPN8/RPN11